MLNSKLAMATRSCSRRMQLEIRIHTTTSCIWKPKPQPLLELHAQPNPHISFTLEEKLEERGREKGITKAC